MFVNEVEVIPASEYESDNQIGSHEVLNGPFDWMSDNEGDIVDDPSRQCCFLSQFHYIFHDCKTHKHHEEAHLKAVPKSGNYKCQRHRTELHLALRLCSIH